MFEEIIMLVLRVEQGQVSGKDTHCTIRPVLYHDMATFYNV